MTLDELIAELNVMRNAKRGNGKLPVFATNMASGASEPVAGPSVCTQADVTDEGPFDVEGDWIDLAIGN